MVVDFIKEVLFFCVPFIQRLICKKNVFENDIKVTPRVSEPVIFNVTSEVPTADIYLNVENKSQYLEVGVPVISFSLWLHDDRGLHSLISQEYILMGEKISKKGSVTLYRRIDLTEFQVRLLQTAKQSKEINVNLDLHVDVSSRLYSFEKRIPLENVHCRLVA
jgi:hypothetical protein